LENPESYEFTDQELAEASFGRIPGDPDDFFDLTS
jgi:hypothetical protein